MYMVEHVALSLDSHASGHCRVEAGHVQHVGTEASGPAPPLLLSPSLSLSLSLSLSPAAPLSLPSSLPLPPSQSSSSSPPPALIRADPGSDSEAAPRQSTVGGRRAWRWCCHQRERCCRWSRRGLALLVVPLVPAQCACSGSCCSSRVAPRRRPREPAQLHGPGPARAARRCAFRQWQQLRRPSRRLGERPIGSRS